MLQCDTLYASRGVTESARATTNVGTWQHMGQGPPRARVAGACPLLSIVRTEATFPHMAASFEFEPER